MGTSKLLKAPLAFQHKKIQPAFDDSLTRIEFSACYKSVKDWKEKTTDFDYWEKRIESIQKALVSVQETLIYKVSFKVFWDSFWQTYNNWRAQFLSHCHQKQAKFSDGGMPTELLIVYWYPCSIAP